MARERQGLADVESPTREGQQHQRRHHAHPDNEFRCGGGFERWIYPTANEQILDNENGTTGVAALLREYYFYACVRAAPTAGDDGPWVISAPTRFVAGGVGPADDLVPDLNTTGQITWDFELPVADRHSSVPASAVSYQVEYIKHETGEASGSLDATDFAAGDANRRRVRTGSSSNGEFVTRDATGAIYTLRYRYSVRLGSTTVRSAWSVVSSQTVP